MSSTIDKSNLSSDIVLKDKIRPDTSKNALKINQEVIKMPSPPALSQQPSASNNTTRKKKNKRFTKHALSDGHIVKKTTTKNGNFLPKLKTNNAKSSTITSTAPATTTNAESSYKATGQTVNINNSVSSNSSSGAKTVEDIDALSKKLSQTKIADDNNMFTGKWIVTPKDSLERITNRLKFKSEVQDLSNISSASVPTIDNVIDTVIYPFETDSPHSDTVLGNDKIEGAYSKIFGWDPWDKINRKCKRDLKRKKLDKNAAQSTENGKAGISTLELDLCRKDHLGGGELKPVLAESPENTPSQNGAQNSLDQNDNESGEYRYIAKRKKSVDFTNEVMVIWFTGEDVVKETKEPLKKELEQQIRNKEMRMGHTLFEGKTGVGKYKDDHYMAGWFKK